VGQYLDLLGTVRGDVGLDQARRISRYKSGKYTVERPLHLGAALAGRLDELAGPLSAFGGPLGEAFQLRDELLGAFGDPAVTGKPVGQDLREGKPTSLLAFAMAAANGASAKLLGDRFGAHDLTPAEVVELQAILEQTGAREQVEAAIHDLLAEALAALEAVPLIDGPVGRQARQQLVELAYFAAGRDH
jgi:geranylgeranyl diphosphate synthase type I